MVWYFRFLTAFSFLFDEVLHHAWEPWEPTNDEPKKEGRRLEMKKGNFAKYEAFIFRMLFHLSFR